MGHTYICVDFYTNTVFRLDGQILVAGEQTEVAAVRNCQKLPLCLTKPEPAGSVMDPLLAKAGPIRNGDKVSLTTDLKGKSYCADVSE